MTIAGTKDIARRIVNAENGFVETLMNLGNISRADAFKVLATFRKAKAVKLHVGIGRITVKHGAYLNPDVIRRAVSLNI